ncbi:MAG TPA: T9SS type A sorting domain-containing protein [Saprospiraceae bacterium]|nr:T9SS type A sorting domain-containing protein [Saprospiraceae bacterium]
MHRNFRINLFLFLILSLSGLQLNANNINWSSTSGLHEVTPVEFNYFNIKEVFNTAVLYWSTLTDVKDNIMIVEKSLDGKAYEEIGRVKGTESRNYNFVDNKPFTTINYYRLTIINTEGTSLNSPVKVLIKEMNSPFSVYPNLVKSNLTVQTRKDLFKETIVHIIFANTGEVVFQTALFSGNYQKDINVSTLAPGSYVAEVQYGTYAFHYTFNKL